MVNLQPQIELKNPYAYVVPQVTVSSINRVEMGIFIVKLNFYID